MDFSQIDMFNMYLTLGARKGFGTREPGRPKENPTLSRRGDLWMFAFIDGIGFLTIKEVGLSPKP